jgi:hypothetical protein
MKFSVQKTRQWIKRYWIISLVLVLLVAGSYRIYVLREGDPFKVTDPDSPYFNPLKYDFNDYKRHPELRTKAIKKSMPQGASLEVIKIIMKHNSCYYEQWSTKTEYPGMVWFSCRSLIRYPYDSAGVSFYFDQNNKLVDYFGSGGPGVYTGKTPEDVMGIETTADFLKRTKNK